MINILIRGKPRSGKSTLIQRIITLLEQQGKQVAGISTPEIRERGRIGFEIVDLASGARGTLAHINQKEGPRISKYRVNLQDLMEMGVEAIRRAIDEKVDFIIIDEIGKMELVSKDFQKVVWDALYLGKVIGTIGLITHPFVAQIYERADLKVVTLTRENREGVFEDLKTFLLDRSK
jgi:nucleoside-triphosphatase